MRFTTRMSTGVGPEFGFARGGETASIRVRVTLRTIASRSPKKTCTGASKPSPLMTTFVPPSFGPEAGVTESTSGWRVPPLAA